MLWADRRVVATVVNQAIEAPAIVRETAHILGTEETWLARIEGREPTLTVWPEADARRLQPMIEAVQTACRRYFESLQEADLERPVTYTNSAGVRFTNTLGEILAHVPLHGQYHRGKVNLLLRQAGLEPAPVDYIAWVRGAPAATEADATKPTQGGAE